MIISGVGPRKALCAQRSRTDRACVLFSQSVPMGFAVLLRRSSSANFPHLGPRSLHRFARGAGISPPENIRQPQSENRIGKCVGTRCWAGATCGIRRKTLQSLEQMVKLASGMITIPGVEACCRTPPYTRGQQPTSAESEVVVDQATSFKIAVRLAGTSSLLASIPGLVQSHRRAPLVVVRGPQMARGGNDIQAPDPTRRHRRLFSLRHGTAHSSTSKVAEL